MNNKGFTLTEVLAVIIILASLMLIAIPAYNGVESTIKNSSRTNKQKAIDAAMLKFANEYLVDEIKGLGTSGSFCQSFDLNNYIIANGIYSAEETNELNEEVVIDPKTNAKWDACLTICYNTGMDITVPNTVSKYSLYLKSFEDRACS